MSTPETGGRLGAALERQQERLLPCVHCGFCLPACPTYDRLGDENDSPRGRLHLMQAVVEGRLDPGGDAFQTHIDRCLGCRACETVCPSGVEYGTLLEHARETAVAARPMALATRALLRVMGSQLMRGVFFASGRAVRALRLASLAVRLLPDGRASGRLRLAAAMLASSSRWVPPPAPPPARSASHEPSAGEEGAGGHGGGVTVGLLSGCVQEGLYRRVNDATRRTLEANGFTVVEVLGQGCCGALHAHAGSLEEARALALRNIEAFERAGAEKIVVNAAGCGAAMKEYATYFEGEVEVEPRAAAVAARVVDVTELLADAGPRVGAPIECSAAYDHPCHLLHAQGVSEPPLRVLGAVPGLEVRVVDRADECCGGAGIYGLTHPDLGGHIGRDKVEAVRAAGAEVACTPNPGCMMQIGAGLRLSGDRTGVAHPVEILDESYRRAGYYK
jgi:glycolate oxidase iron-sulfur subunit